MKILSVFRLLSGAFFIALSSVAMAQNAGTVTNHAIPLGRGASVQGYGSLALASGQIVIGQTSADPQAVTPSGDVTINASGVTAIGANKVTNSQLATMGANTTKCNATAGTANPTDCTASTMKTNLGLVIGTNVEAWDNDLDCLAALATTGLIHRTGTGTCSAGAAALSDLATGTQDTVIGYFGSTAASAGSIPNCTGALVYSTSTHLFGCNATAGTGTVTSAQVIGAGLTVNSGTCTITSTGACTLTTTAATKTDQQTASSGTVVVTPSQQQNHPSAMKAIGYATLSGTTLTDHSPYNASISRTGLGTYTISFTPVNFANANYSCTITPSAASTASVFVAEILGAKSASSMSFGVFQATAFGAADPTAIDVHCAGSQ